MITQRYILNIFRTTALVMLLLSLLAVSGAQSVVDVQPERRVDQIPDDVIAILGAFPEEIRFLLTQIQDVKQEFIQRTSFTTGTLRGKRVVVALTGIGKVNAATTTMLAIEHFRPKVVLFTGIAGGIHPQMMPGDIVIGKQVAYHDYGTLSSSGMQRGPTRDPVTHTENPLYFPCDTAWVKLAERSSEKISWEKIVTGNGSRVPTVRTGLIVTGDVFVASDSATRELYASMKADATEMEGAAVAQVCYQQRVPVLIIRSMSDNAGNNASHDIKTFYGIAARNSAEFVMAIVGASQSVKQPAR